MLFSVPYITHVLLSEISHLKMKLCKSISKMECQTSLFIQTAYYIKVKMASRAILHFWSLILVVSDSRFRSYQQDKFHLFQWRHSMEILACIVSLTVFHVVPCWHKLWFYLFYFICPCGLHIQIPEKKPSLSCKTLNSAAVKRKIQTYPWAESTVVSLPTHVGT